MLDLGREWVTVSAPATIANVGPGFDVLGIAIKNLEDVCDSGEEPTFLGDIVHIRRGTGRHPLVIRDVYVNGIIDHSLTREVNQNVVGIAAQEVISGTRNTEPLEIILEKMPFRGSGMGSSAASVVAGAYAALVISGSVHKNKIAETVVKCEVGSHPDNVLPALFGGVVATYGLTEDQNRLHNLYDQDILALKGALCLLRDSDLDTDVIIGELSKEAGNQYISDAFTLFKKIKGNFRIGGSREGQKAQYYSLLLEALEKKAGIYGADKIVGAINYLRKRKGQDLLSLISELGDMGIKEIDVDLRKIETYEKRRRKRIEEDYDMAQIKQRDKLTRLLEESLSRKLRKSSSSTINLDYKRLVLPDGVLDKIYFVLIKPDISISTLEARRLINKTPALGDVVANSRSLAKLLTCLYEGNLKGFGEAVCQDRIVEPARAPLIPGYHNVKETALRLDAYGFNISGSGPTCFAVTDDIQKARTIAGGCMGKFDEAGSKSTAYICKVDLDGAKKVI